MQNKNKRFSQLVKISKKIRFKLQNYLALILYKVDLLFFGNKKLNPKIIHIAFSFDRALQLENYIRTFKENCTNYFNIDFFVIYKCSSKLHVNAYEKLKDKYKEINFIHESNFKKNINNILRNYRGNQIISFGVDDIEFIRPFSLSEIYKRINDLMVSKRKKIIFSLRHGTNLKKSIQCNLEKMDLPFDLKSEGKYLYWNFKYDKSGEWGYPLAVDCHFYPLRDLKTFIRHAYFYSPNSLEASLQILNKQFSDSIGISYSKSICFNNLNNKVQNEYQNYSLNSNTDLLAQKYLEGFSIKQKKDILTIQHSTHLPYNYKLIREGE